MDLKINSQQSSGNCEHVAVTVSCEEEEEEEEVGFVSIIGVNGMSDADW
jgi:hypothetical protein